MTVVSHEYKFIFVKTGKTAGTAIEVELSKIGGPDDVFTKVFPPVEGHKPRNSSGFGPFMSAIQIRNNIGQERFSNYFKFAVERSPIDKCLSQYGMKINSPDHNSKTANLSWGEYIKKGNFPVDAKLYTKDGNIIIDRILKYENLENDLSQVFSELGVPWTGLKIRPKSGFRFGIPSINEVLPKHRKVIRSAFRDSLRFTPYYLGDF